MSKSTFDFDPKQLATVKAQFALESIGVQLETFDWVRSLQWAIKAIASESDGLERIKLERIQHLAAASVYLASEALEALRDDVELLQGGGEV